MATNPQAPQQQNTLPLEKQTVRLYGREYGAYRSGQYILPHDDTERDRLDVMWALIKCLRNDRLTDAPTYRLEFEATGWEPRPRVLDLGCGTGLWMSEMAEAFPNAEFVGVDIHRMGAAKLLPNVVCTAPWDYEGPWALGERSWDLIHLQMALGSVSNWPALCEKIRDHLVPGHGWFESVEFDYQPYAEEEPLPEGQLKKWWESYIQSAFEALGRRIHYDHDMPKMLDSLGFKDITYTRYKIPLNEWTQDKTENRASLWWQIAMGPGHNGSGGFGLEALSLYPLCRLSGWPPLHVRRLCNEVLVESSDPRLRVFNCLHVITARAPDLHERNAHQQ